MKKIAITILLFLPLLLYGQGMNVMHTSNKTMGAGGGSSPTYTTQYQALLDEWTTDPQGDTLTWQNVLVDSLVTYGYWDRGDLLYVIANNNETNAFINWLDPSAGTYDLTEVGAGNLVFTPYSGIKGDGVNYLTTGWNPTTVTATSNYSLDDASIGIYIRTEAPTLASIMGIDNGSTDRLYISPKYTTNSLAYLRANASSSLSIENIESRGFYIGTRTASDATALYKNGEELISGTVASSSLPDNNLFLLTRDGSTIADHQISIAFVMDGVTSDEQAQLNRFFEQYMANLERGVQFGRGGYETITLDTLDSDSTKAWFVANEAYTLFSEGDTVETWLDISGNSYDLWQPSAGSQYLPTFGSDGTNDTLDFRTGSIQLENLDFTQAQPFTVYFVAKYRDYVSSGYQQFLEFDGIDFQYGDDNGTTIDWYVTSNPGSLSASSTNEIPVGEYCVVTVVVNGTSSSIRINDNTADTGGTINPDIDATRIIVSHNGMDFSARELIIRGGTEETDITSYLMTKYGIE